MPPSSCSVVVQGTLLWQEWEGRAHCLVDNKAPAMHGLQQVEAALRLYGAAGKPGHLQCPDRQWQRAAIPEHRSDLTIIGDSRAGAVLCEQGCLHW